MRVQAIHAAMLVLTVVSGALAADGPVTQPADRQAAADVTYSAVESGQLTPTPEMWFYQQEIRRHDDPKQAVRRNAEYRAAQRRMRLESQKWYGYSPLRPTVNPTPWFGSYGPRWTSTMGDPNRWMAGGAPTVVVIPRAP